MTQQTLRFNLNKSFLTNLVALIFVLLSLVIQEPKVQLMLSNIGFFALSGALTNWIAVYMLFEKVPGFYGSGVIENRFEDLKKAIQNLIQEQFFNPLQIKLILEKESSVFSAQLEKLALHLDYEALYQGLMDGIMNSSLGGMLQMIGGQKALAPMKDKVVERMQQTFVSHLQDKNFQDKMRDALKSEQLIAQFQADLEHLLTTRLSHMTPQMVKMMMKQIMERHLGWLVIWGGVFGGLLGLIKSLMVV